jgi:glycosyltransferase involved in cell wall biosynthesis
MTDSASRAPAVSVVLPAFNARVHVARAIGSVLEQDFGDFELLVVDDGSTDGTEDVVRALRDARIIYHRLPTNRGQSVARNIGIRAARAGLVAFHDADDLWMAGKLSAQVAALGRNSDAALCYGDLLRCEPDGRAAVLAAPLVRQGQLFDNRPTLYATYGIGIQTCVIRKAALLECQGFDERLRCFEDLDLFLRLARRHSFVKLERSVTIYVASRGVSSDAVRNRDARRRLLRRYGFSMAWRRPRGLCRELWNLASDRDLGAVSAGRRG